MNYENRVVAFIDILGFKGVLNDTVKRDGSDNTEKINEVIRAFEAIRGIWDLDKKSEFLDTKSSGTKKITIFSDSIVISFAADEPSEVFYTLLEIKWLIMRLLWHGLLCRGAVSIGKFIHTNEYLFGPALAEAYLLESKAALYPRIILDRPVIENGAMNSSHHDSKTELEFVESLLEQDSDGMYYIDYFFKAQHELDDPEYDFPDYIENLGNIIRKGLMASSHPTKADLRVKYSWMRERYNRMVSIVSSNEVVLDYRASSEIKLADFYENLKPISPRRDIASKFSGYRNRRR